MKGWAYFFVGLIGFDVLGSFMGNMDHWGVTLAFALWAMFYKFPGEAKS